MTQRSPVVLITGVSSGIGRAVADVFAANASATARPIPEETPVTNTTGDRFVMSTPSKPIGVLLFGRHATPLDGRCKPFGILGV